MSSEEVDMPLESALGDLRTTLWAFDQVTDTYFAGETDAEDSRTWEHRVNAMRRTLLRLVNELVDVYGPVNSKENGPRAHILWEMHTSTLAKYGVIPTEDGKMFTLIKKEDERADRDS